MEKFAEPLTQAALLFAAMFVLTALGITLVRRYRDREADDMSDTSNT